MFKSSCPSPRKIPLASRESLKCELDEMVKNEIAHETKLTDWIYSMAVVDEGYKIRICFGPKNVFINKVKETVLFTVTNGES